MTLIPKQSIQGAGGKGGGGGGGHESDDSIFSRAIIDLVEVYSEGEVDGLTNGGKSLYVDNTPVIAASGAQNHKVYWEVRRGTQVQSPVSSAQTISGEDAINTIATYGTPAIGVISSADADFAVVTVGFPRLMSADEKGNVDGATVQFKIECQPLGGSYAPVARVSVRTNGVFAIIGDYYQSPALTYRADVYLRKDAAGQIDIEHSTGGGGWSVIDTVQLFESKTTPGAFVGNASLDLPEGVNYLRWAGGDGPGNSVVWFNYVSGDVITVTGKNMSRAQKQYRFELTGDAPWSVRLTRLTEDSASVKLANECWFDSLRTEIVARLGYPNSALIHWRIPAKEFSSIPRRRAEWRGIRVRVPTNYDPVTRGYNGIWDGSFKVAWTNNPAWCFYDLCVERRYGLGGFISAAEVDKWRLYEIGKYCDGLVDSGSRDSAGGIIYEPRFTLNIQIFEPREALNVLRDLASVFRGMMYVIGGVLSAACDQPADPVKLFNHANVIGGQFKFSGTGGLARKTVALVEWRDPANLYNKAVHYVANDDEATGIPRYGVNPTTVIAFGCTSRGQAHRLGKFVLLDGEVVNFSIGHESATVAPGEVIKCMIPLRNSGKRLGGRLQYALGTMVILDAPVDLVAGHDYQLSIALADGAINSRTVVFSGTQTTDTIYIETELDGEVVDYAIWVLIDLDGIQPTLWRVLNILPGEGFIAQVVATSYDPGRFNKIDVFDSAIDDALLPSVNPLNIDPVSDITVENIPFVDKNEIVQNKLHIHWSQVVDAAGYQVRWRLNAGNWHKTPQLTGTLFEMIVKDDGAYEVEIVAISVLGIPSAATLASFMIIGDASPISLSLQWA